MNSMSSKDRRGSQTVEKRNSLPSSRSSILSKTLSLTCQNTEKVEDSSIEEIFSSYIGFLQAIYQLQLQRDASFLGNLNSYYLWLQQLTIYYRSQNILKVNFYIIMLTLI